MDPLLSELKSDLDHGSADGRYTAAGDCLLLYKFILPEDERTNHG